MNLTNKANKNKVVYHLLDRLLLLVILHRLLIVMLYCIIPSFLIVQVKIEKNISFTKRIYLLLSFLSLSFTLIR